MAAPVLQILERGSSRQSQSCSHSFLQLPLLSIQVAGLQGCANPPCSKSVGAAGTWTRVFCLHDRRSTNWATDLADRNECRNIWLMAPKLNCRPGISASKLIHDEWDRWQHQYFKYWKGAALDNHGVSWTSKWPPMKMLKKFHNIFSKITQNI